MMAEGNNQNVLMNKREEVVEKARKAKREEQFKKRRKVEVLSMNQTLDTNILETSQPNDDIPTQQHLQESPYKQHILDILERDYQQNTLLTFLVQLKQDGDMLTLLEAAIAIRKILCDEQNCPIQELIDANGVPILLKYMIDPRESHLQLECAWALTNVVCGTSQQTKSVVQLNAISCFVTLLHHRWPKVAEQAIWALGNIAGDSHVFRDMILKQNALPALCHLIMHENSPTQIRHQGIWTLSNLCRGRPLPDYKLTKDALPVFCHAIQGIRNYSVLSDATWALSYLSDGDSSRIQKTIDTGVVKSLVNYLTCPMVSVQIPVMRVLGNLMTGTDHQTDIILGEGVLAKLFMMLETDNPAIRREIVWNISNIAAGTPSQINQIFGVESQIDKMKEMLENDVMEVQEETLMTLKNAIIKGNQYQIEMIYKSQFMKSLIFLFKSEYLLVLIPAIECVQRLLQLGKSLMKQDNNNLFLNQFQQFDGDAQLENLQQHPSDQVYELAAKIIEDYFEIEQDQY